MPDQNAKLSHVPGGIFPSRAAANMLGKTPSAVTSGATFVLIYLEESGTKMLRFDFFDLPLFSP